MGKYSLLTILAKCTLNIALKFTFSPGGGGGYFRNFWAGMCRWDPGTLNLYQS